VSSTSEDPATLSTATTLVPIITLKEALNEDEEDEDRSKEQTMSPPLEPELSEDDSIKPPVSPFTFSPQMEEPDQSDDDEGVFVQRAPDHVEDKLIHERRNESNGNDGEVIVVSPTPRLSRIPRIPEISLPVDAQSDS